LYTILNLTIVCHTARPTFVYTAYLARIIWQQDIRGTKRPRYESSKEWNIQMQSPHSRITPCVPCPVGRNSADDCMQHRWF